MTRPGGSLTRRGWAFIAAAIIAAAVAVVLGHSSILIVAAFFASFPLWASLSMVMTRPRLTATRPTTPLEVTRGEIISQQLQIRRHGGWMFSEVLAEEHLPSALGRDARFLVTGQRHHRESTVRIPVPAQRRGRFQLGPLSTRMTDPFGIIAVHQSWEGTNEVVVLPQIHELSDEASGRSAGLRELAGRMAHAGSDDVMVREYQTGDDVRRIHWRSSAKAQQLMVRRVEQARDLSVTLLMDTRRAAHPGATETSFEWVVSAAASISAHCLSQGFDLRVYTPDGTVLPASSIRTPSATVAAFADVTMSKHDQLLAHAAMERAPGTSLFIFVGGLLSPHDAEDLAEAARPRRGIAMCCSCESSATNEPASSILRHSGWITHTVHPDISVREAWMATTTLSRRI